MPYKEVKLQGKIEDCCCQFDYLKQFNQQINPVLKNLIKTNFFRLYKVNLDNTCPFWAQEHLCKDKNTCGICPCEDDQIPEAWKNEDLLKKEKNTQVDLKWRKFVEPAIKKTDWILGEDDEENGVYVDLTQNDESYTGYQGANIWEIIYKENCFNKSDLCLEERLLNRAISGLHASVSTHLAYKYKNFKKGTEFVN